jgi:4-hydroxy-tetrahydrodipicolinate reductase
MVDIALFGATGRMGRQILPLIAASDDLRLTGALAASGNPAIGRDAATIVALPALGAVVTDDVERALDGAQLAIDFTRPAASVAHARACAARGCPIVIGTTGHDAAAHRELTSVAGVVPVLLAPNMSLGVNLLLRLAELAARALPGEYDAEIFEAHHRDKLDSPSGTALALGEAVARARGTTLAESAVYSRVGAAAGPRPPGAIGFSVLRAGEIVGEHRLVFAGPGERVELAHHAADRSGFARGALAAARWLASGRKPGLYRMPDVFGL